MIGAAWSAFHIGDNRRAAPLAADGLACARYAGEPPLEVWGRNLLAEARLAAARGDTATATGALRWAADGGRRVAMVMFVPFALAGLASWLRSPGRPTAAGAVGEARTSSAAAARRSPPPRSATPRAPWPGTGASSPPPST